MIKSEVVRKVKSLYPYEKWYKKVNAMSTAQVYAIFNKNFYLDGQPKLKSSKIVKMRSRKSDQIPGQMELSDFIEI